MAETKYSGERLMWAKFKWMMSWKGKKGKFDYSGDLNNLIIEDSSLCNYSFISFYYTT